MLIYVPNHSTLTLESLLVQISPSVFSVIKLQTKDLIQTKQELRHVSVTSTFTLIQLTTPVKDVMILYVVSALPELLPVMFVLATLILEALAHVHVTLDFSNLQQKLLYVNNVILLVKTVLQQPHVQHVKKVTAQEKLQTKVVYVKSDFMILENLYVLFVARNV